MNWTFKNLKRLMDCAGLLFTMGIMFCLFGFIWRSDVFIGAALLVCGFVILVTIHRAGPPSDFRDHVDSEGREIW